MPKATLELAPVLAVVDVAAEQNQQAATEGITQERDASIGAVALEDALVRFDHGDGNILEMKLGEMVRKRDPNERKAGKIICGGSFEGMPLDAAAAVVTAIGAELIFVQPAAADKADRAEAKLTKDDKKDTAAELAVADELAASQLKETNPDVTAEVELVQPVVLSDAQLAAARRLQEQHDQQSTPNKTQVKAPTKLATTATVKKAVVLPLVTKLAPATFTPMLKTAARKVVTPVKDTIQASTEVFRTKAVAEKPVSNLYEASETAIPAVLELSSEDPEALVPEMSELAEDSFFSLFEASLLNVDVSEEDAANEVFSMAAEFPELMGKPKKS